jgi:hypothetical protein
VGYRGSKIVREIAGCGGSDRDKAIHIKITALSARNAISSSREFVGAE